MPQLKSTGVHIVKAEWFWTSVQHEYRQAERDFKIDDVSTYSEVNSKIRANIVFWLQSFVRCLSHTRKCTADSFRMIAIQNVFVRSMASHAAKFMQMTSHHLRSDAFRRREMTARFSFRQGTQACNISTASVVNTTPLSASTTTITTTSGGRNRKRKRLKDRFPSFSSDLSPGQLAQKRRSSASDATRLDVTRLSEGSYLDITHSPDIVDGKSDGELDVVALKGGTI